MQEEGLEIAPAADLAADTPVVFERGSANASQPRAFPWLSLIFGAIAGVVGSGIGAVALGLWYQAQHGSERAAFDALAESFFSYMLCTGALAGLVIRLGIAIFDRAPVLGAAAFGAIAGLGPGAFAAREFGMKPLPFVGVTGIAIATVPMVLVVAFVHARSDRREEAAGRGGRRGGAVGPAICTIATMALLGGLGALLARQVETPPLVDVLRLYLFVGIERIGAALGALVGLILGLAVGLTVRLHRFVISATSKTRPAH